MSATARSTIAAVLGSAGHELLDTVFPRSCAACDRPLHERGAALCAVCAERLAAGVAGDYCGCCGGDVGLHLLVEGRCTTCQNKRPWYEQLRRVGRYEGVLRDLILRFKYGRAPTLDVTLGDWMADAAAGSAAMGDVQMWIPIPSARLRLWRRGYQPTRLLAERIGVRTGRPWGGVLRLARSIAEQKTLAAEERTGNVKSAFRVVRGAGIAGATVGLVDDVCTSGATLREAARTLRGAGAERVYAVVLAAAKPGMGA